MTRQCKGLALGWTYAIISHYNIYCEPQFRSIVQSFCIEEMSIGSKFTREIRG